MRQPAEYMTFVVRLQRTPDDEIAGVVERVRTGEKARFRGMEMIADAIVRMLSNGAGDESAAP
jgi:hypothetical protein